MTSWARQSPLAVLAYTQIRKEGRFVIFRRLHRRTKKQPSSALASFSYLSMSATVRRAASLHKTMKASYPGAVFISTGTPLLKQDALTSLESSVATFIHNKSESRRRRGSPRLGL